VISQFPTSLDRSLVHVFVFGAAIGEAIAVALPNTGWVLVDGCRLELEGEERFPAIEVFKNLRAGIDDAIELLVWTHPHADHYQGIRECIEIYRPRRVGMTLVEAPPPGSPAREVEALGTHPTLPADLRLQDVFKLVRSTLERVFLYWRERPDSRLPLSAQAAPLTLGATRVRAFSPDSQALGAFYGLPLDGLRAALKERANEYSVVLGLEFGATRLVLGGDLPYSRGALIPHAWHLVSEAAPELAEHDLFKVSHHGSAEALPPAFRRRAAPSREWLVAPFAREHLPRPGDDETGGLRQMLLRVDEVRLTSSAGLMVPPTSGARIPRSVLREKLAAVVAGGLSGGLRVPAAKGAFDFAWGVGLDNARNVRGLFAGAQALTVIEG
jgi:hypothetical protein